MFSKISQLKINLIFPQKIKQITEGTIYLGPEFSTFLIIGYQYYVGHCLMSGIGTRRFGGHLSVFRYLAVISSDSNTKNIFRLVVLLILPIDIFITVIKLIIIHLFH